MLGPSMFFIALLVLGGPPPTENDDIGLFLQQHAYSKTTDPQKVFLLGNKDYKF